MSARTAQQYLDNFIEFATPQNRNDRINYRALHEEGTDLVFRENRIDISTITRLNKGGNSLIFKVETPEKYYIKVGWSWDYDNNTEKDADSMLLESITNKMYNNIDPTLLSGVDNVWKIPRGKLITRLFPLNSASAFPHFGKTAYDIALIKAPVSDYVTLYDMIHDNSHVDKTAQLVMFAAKLIALSLKTGFTHNDLHPKNVLYDKNNGRFMMIDLGRSYMVLDTEDAKNIYSNEYAKLVLSMGQGTYMDLVNNANKVQNIVGIENDMKEFFESGWIKPLPMDYFQAYTYVLFDLMTLYKSLGYYNRIDAAFSTGIRNIQKPTLPDYVSGDPNNFPEVEVLIVDLLQFWYFHYVYTLVDFMRKTGRATRDWEAYENMLFYFYKGGYSYWLDAYKFAELRDRFYQTLDETKIEQVLNKISTHHNPTRSVGGKKKKGGMQSRDYGDILADIEDEKEQLRRMVLNRRMAPIVAPRSVEASMGPMPQPSEISVATGGNGKKRSIMFQGKTRKVHMDKSSKYIILQKERVYLKDIRGKYRYV